MKSVSTCLILVVLLVAACAPNPSGGNEGIRPTMDRPTSASPAEPSPDPVPPGSRTDTTEVPLGEASNGLFAVTLTGAVDTTFASGGSYTCDNGTELLSTTSEDGSSSLVFRLPPGTAAGEYTIGGESDTISAELTVNGTAYTGDSFGIVTTVVMPASAGDPVSGSFDMNFTGADDSSVNATGTFDLP
ncbi:MAG: hypothetical protein AAGK74_19815, partial [Chloroflexota bacterium]